MNARLQDLRERVRRRDFGQYRKTDLSDIRTECDRRSLSWTERASLLTQRQCQAERPVILPEERIVFTRTVPGVPPLYSEEEWDRLFEGKRAHELGPISNICPAWDLLLRQGLLGRREIALEGLARYAADPAAVEFLSAAIQTIDAVLDLTHRYMLEARKQERSDLVELLSRDPARPART
ncbi:hypothetical protein HQ520_13825, partial [bacterium]|nr:hypothetical protein [bacterium]